MPFLARLFGKKKHEREVQETREVDLEVGKIAEWIQDSYKEELASSRETMGQQQNKITEIFSNIREIVKRIEQDTRWNSKEYARVVMSRNDFAKAAFQSLSRIPKTQTSSQDFLKQCEDIFSELTHLKPKQGILLSYYYEKETKELTKTIKQAKKNLEDLKEALSEAHALSALEEVERAEKNIKKNEEEERNFLKSLETKKTEAERKRQALDALEKQIGQQGEAVQDLEREDNRSQRTLAIEKAKLESLLFSARRPLEMIVHEGGCPETQAYLKQPLEYIFSEGIQKISRELETSTKGLGEKDKKRLILFLEQIKTEVPILKARIRTLTQDMEKARDALSERSQPLGQRKKEREHLKITVEGLKGGQVALEKRLREIQAEKTKALDTLKNSLKDKLHIKPMIKQ